MNENAFFTITCPSFSYCCWGINHLFPDTKLWIKTEKLLKSLFSFDFYAFILRSLSRKSVLLWMRAIVAYRCLFSDLRYICNTCT